MTFLRTNNWAGNKLILKIIPILFFSLFSLLIVATPAKANAGLQEDITNATSADDVKEIIENAGPIDNMSGQNIPPTAGNPSKLFLRTNQGNIPFTLSGYQKSPLVGDATVRFFFLCDWNPKLYYIHRADWGFPDGNDLYWMKESAPSPTDDWIAGEMHCGPRGYLDDCDTGFKAWLDTVADADWEETMEALGIGETTFLEALAQNSLGQALQEILQETGKAIGYIANYVLDMVEKILIVDVNKDGITRGWAAVKDASNIMLVVALLFIAFFNAIRFQIDYYTAKALIPRLALAAIAINFSFLITKGIIDFGNIFTDYFINLTQINNILDLNATSNLIGGTVAIGGAILAGILLGWFALIIALVAVGILLAVLFFRIGLLYILTMFSPLVFLFSVLPFTRELTKQWWNYIVRYAFMGAVISLILYAASSI